MLTAGGFLLGGKLNNCQRYPVYLLVWDMTLPVGSSQPTCLCLLNQRGNRMTGSLLLGNTVLCTLNVSVQLYSLQIKNMRPLK